MYFPDLSNECQVDKGPHVRAIGWLSVEHAFSTGVVPPIFIESLRAHLQNPCQPVVTWGSYRCNLCPAHLSDGPISGSRNLWVPSYAFVYVAPELILHYIEVHLYKPPDEFINAVQIPRNRVQANTWMRCRRSCSGGAQPRKRLDSQMVHSQLAS